MSQEQKPSKKIYANKTGVTSTTVGVASIVGLESLSLPGSEFNDIYAGIVGSLLWTGARITGEVLRKRRARLISKLALDD